MSDALDARIQRRLPSLPEPTRGLLGAAIAPDAPDPWNRDVLLAYLRYFTRLFDLAEAADRAEAALADALASLAAVPRSADDEADIEAAETLLSRGFTERGYQFLGGRTPPHFGGTSGAARRTASSA